MQYNIQPGNTFCDESNVNLIGDIAVIQFDLTLNSSILYDLGTLEKNNACQKLFGVSFGINNHINSWRLGYSMASVPNKKIYLRNYMYNQGRNLNFKFALSNQKITILGNVKIIGAVFFNRSTNLIFLKIPILNIEQYFDFNFTGVSKNCYQQFFYFEPQAKKLMKIELDQTYNKI